MTPASGIHNNSRWLQKYSRKSARFIFRVSNESSGAVSPQSRIAADDGEKKLDSERMPGRPRSRSSATAARKATPTG